MMFFFQKKGENSKSVTKYNPWKVQLDDYDVKEE